MDVIKLRKMTRVEIQKKVEPALRRVAETLLAYRDVSHARRFARTLCHLAARITVDWGGGPEEFRDMMSQAWAKELNPQSPSDTVYPYESPKGVN
jgi:hypothetical protein